MEEHDVNLVTHWLYLIKGVDRVEDSHERKPYYMHVKSHWGLAEPDRPS